MNIVWKRPDGGVLVTMLTDEGLQFIRNRIGAKAIIEDVCQAHAKDLQQRGDIPADHSIAAVAITLPVSREWRQAWTWTTSAPTIDVDPVKAVAVTKDRLRAERAPLLAGLDIQFQRAQEADAEVADIVAEKTRLRDITKLADAIKPGNLSALSALTCQQ